MWQQTKLYSSKNKFIWSLADEVLKNPLEARVFSYEREFKIKDIWQIKTHAQAPALGVSSSSDENNIVQLDLSNEKDEEILSPAS